MQLGAIITQDNRPIAFFSRKLSETQQKFSVTEIELLAIVEILKEFKGMLWGQDIKSTLITKMSQEMPYDSPLTEYTVGGYFWKRSPRKII
jgi:hypothetical protein